MKTFEEKITDAVKETLNNGSVEKIVEQYIEKGVSDALKEIFSWNGAGRKLLEEKLNETIVPVIERHNFNQYLTKLDSVLTELINATAIPDNRKILENFKGLIKEPEIKRIKLSEIFQRYCRHVAENVSTDSLESNYEDGELYYEPVTARMEVEHEDKGWFKSMFDNCVVKFTCEEDGDLNCQIKLYKETKEKIWNFNGCRDSVDINSLRNLSSFELFLMTLKRSYADIVMDRENDCDDDIEPEKKPEWSID